MVPGSPGNDGSGGSPTDVPLASLDAKGAQAMMGKGVGGTEDGTRMGMTSANNHLFCDEDAPSSWWEDRRLLS